MDHIYSVALIERQAQAAADLFNSSAGKAEVVNPYDRHVEQHAHDVWKREFDRLTAGTKARVLVA